MAGEPKSKIIGRAPCPECGFGAAHVKKSIEKGTVFRFCPEDGCKAQYIPRGSAAVARLMAAMRPTEQAANTTHTATEEKPPAATVVEPDATPTGTEHVAVETGTATATAPKRRGLFS